MKKLLVLLLFGALLGYLSPVQAGKKSRILRPSKTSSRTIMISGKSFPYYTLSPKRWATINFRGPGELRIITRARFIPKAADRLNYQLLYTVDGGKPNVLKVKRTKRSSKATFKKGALGVPGRRKDLMLKLGRGYHTLKIKLNNIAPEVVARFVFTSKRAKKQNWLTLSPLAPVEPVELITNETITKYYRFSQKNPLRVDIIGPTQLRILTRVENHYNMKGRIHYRLQISSKKGVQNTYLLSSRHSNVTAYKNNPKMLPGRAREIVINVPRGRHQYKIIPLDKDKSTILGRMLFPEKDSALTEE